MNNLIQIEFEKKLNSFINLNDNNKNFIITYKFKKKLEKNRLLNSIKKIKYKDIVNYVKDNNNNEILYIEDFEEKFSPKNKNLYNIIVFKSFNNKKVNINFIFFVKNKIDMFYNNSYIFI